MLNILKSPIIFSNKPKKANDIGSTFNQLTGLIRENNMQILIEYLKIANFSNLYLLRLIIRVRIRVCVFSVC